MDSPVAINYVRAVYDDYFIYEVRPGEQATNTEAQLYKRGYKVAEDGTIELEDDIVPVVLQTEYVEVTAQSSHDDDNTNGGDKEMSKDKGCCPEKVTQLIENKDTKFTEEDREWLTALAEDQLDKMVPEVPEVKDNAGTDGTDATGDGDTVTDNQDQDQSTSADGKMPTFKDLLETADPKVREKIEYGFQTYDQRRAELTETICNREGSPWTAEELESKSITELEKLAVWAQPKANYQGQGGGFVNTNSEEEPLAAVGYDYGVME